MEGLKGFIDATAGRLLYHIVWNAVPFGNQLSRFYPPTPLTPHPQKLKRLRVCFLFFAIILGFLSEIPEKVFVFVYLLPLGVSDSHNPLVYLVGTLGVWAVGLGQGPRQINGPTLVFVF